MATKEETRALMKLEGNILEYPIFTLSRGKKDTIKRYTFEVVDRFGNVTEKRELEIQNAKGIPSAFNMDVFNALMRIWARGSYGESISFTIYEVAKELGLNANSMRIKQSIKDAILNLASTRLTFENAFYLNREYITENFSLFDNVTLYSREMDKENNPRRAREVNRVKLNEWLLRSIDSRYYKYIDFNTYRTLSSGVARRLFEFLEKKKLDKSSFKIGITKLAERLPLDTKKISQLKQILDKANAQLQKHNVITSWTYKDGQILYRFPKSGLALKLAGEEGVDVAKPLSEEPGVSDGPEALVSLLTGRGITKAIAKSLVERYPNRILSQIEVFDWLVKTNSPKVKDNPPGFLRKSIEEDWAPPANFVSKAERERRKKELEEKRRKQAEAEARRVAHAQKVNEERKRRMEESPYRDIWGKVKEHLRGKMVSQSFSSWIAPLYISSIEDNKVVIDCPSAFALDLLEESYRNSLEEAVREVQGRKMEVELVCEEGAERQTGQ